MGQRYVQFGDFALEIRVEQNGDGKFRATIFRIGPALSKRIYSTGWWPDRNLVIDMAEDTIGPMILLIEDLHKLTLLRGKVSVLQIPGSDDF